MDAPEPLLNYDGANFWLDKPDALNGNYINAETVKAFIHYFTEYQPARPCEETTWQIDYETTPTPKALLPLVNRCHSS